MHLWCSSILCYYSSTAEAASPWLLPRCSGYVTLKKEWGRSHGHNVSPSHSDTFWPPSHVNISGLNLFFVTGTGHIQFPKAQAMPPLQQIGAQANFQLMWHPHSLISPHLPLNPCMGFPALADLHQCSWKGFSLSTGTLAGWVAKACFMLYGCFTAVGTSRRYVLLAQQLSLPAWVAQG